MNLTTIANDLIAVHDGVKLCFGFLFLFGRNVKSSGLGSAEQKTVFLSGKIYSMHMGFR